MKRAVRNRWMKLLFTPLILFGLLLLLVSTGILFVQGRSTLAKLMAQGPGSHSTQIFGQWIEMRPGAALRPEYILQELKELGYEPARGEPQKPGQYTYFPPTLVVYTRDFAYPDRVLPAELIRLQFAGDRLEHVKGKNLLDDGGWRVEPKKLAELASRGEAARVHIRLAELPRYVPQAILAVEDKRFYHHGAFDVLGVGRALYVDLHGGRIRQGASTISQQLARSIFLTASRTWKRKILEGVFAVYLEARFKKSELLEMYMNQVYWGQNGSDSLLGIDSASRSFFGKSATQLSLGESALLAGLLQSPNHFSPRTVPSVALERRHLVLNLMLSQHLISGIEFQKADSEPLEVSPAIGHTNTAAYFLATLEDGLEQKYMVPNLADLGWRIFTTLDPVLQRIAEGALKPSVGQAALVAIDPHSGAVRAWVGGTKFQTSAYDRAALARRQPGSAFKPFVVLAALDQKHFTTASMLDDQPLSLRSSGGRWRPKNYDRNFRGKASVWDLLVQSLNVPAVELGLKVGLPTIADYAHRAGVQSAMRLVPSLPLGTSEVSVPELTNAYATLAAGGIFRSVYRIDSILDGQDRLVEEHQPAPQRVFDPGSVYLVTQMLRAVFTEGTARPAKELGFSFPAAGKTGTSENYQDAWFMGYTSSLACGVWVGFDKPKSLGRAAAGIALPVWVSFMNKALPLFPAETLEPPKDVIWKSIDVETGLLAKSGCKNHRNVAFLEGTAPVTFCSAHPGGLLGFFYRLRH